MKRMLYVPAVEHNFESILRLNADNHTVYLTRKKGIAKNKSYVVVVEERLET